MRITKSRAERLLSIFTQKGYTPSLEEPSGDPKEWDESHVMWMLKYLTADGATQQEHARKHGLSPWSVSKAIAAGIRRMETGRKRRKPRKAATSTEQAPAHPSTSDAERTSEEPAAEVPVPLFWLRNIRDILSQDNSPETIADQPLIEFLAGVVLEHTRSTSDTMIVLDTETFGRVQHLYDTRSVAIQNAHLADVAQVIIYGRAGGAINATCEGERDPQRWSDEQLAHSIIRLLTNVVDMPDATEFDRRHVYIGHKMATRVYQAMVKYGIGDPHVTAGTVSEKIIDDYAPEDSAVDCAPRIYTVDMPHHLEVHCPTGAMFIPKSLLPRCLVCVQDQDNVCKLAIYNANGAALMDITYAGVDESDRLAAFADMRQAAADIMRIIADMPR